MTLGLSPEMYFVALAVAAIAAVPGYGLAAKALALVLVLILHVNWPMAQALWVPCGVPGHSGCLATCGGIEAGRS